MSEIDFQTLIAETKGIVLSAIQKYLYAENLDYIDDVAQETYLRVYKALKENKFNSKAELSTWIYKIAKNESLRMNENVMRQKRKVEKLKDSFSNTQKEETFLLYDIWNILKNLPNKYKLIYEKLLEGKTQSEISQELNLRLGTVKSRIFRGKKFFKDLE